LKYNLKPKIMKQLTEDKTHPDTGMMSGDREFSIRNYFSILLISLVVAPLFLTFSAPCQVNETTKSRVKILVWSDEFDYSGLPDTSKWRMEVGKARANNEPQYYTNDLKNAEVKDGKLTITCRIETVDSVKRYTSARINTRGKYQVTLGRIEARAKLPRGRGVWPAFWTLGLTGRWPACGEIDIMEYWGHDANTLASNVHTRDYNHTKGTGRGGKTTFENPFNDFHIYAVEWFPDRMDFYFDDKMFYSCVSKGEGEGEWPFTAPQYLILNLALWNNWRGEPGIDDSIFPQKFVVDYVRVYEMK
jgi:beta-glucanase (GH16 family)